MTRTKTVPKNPIMNLKENEMNTHILNEIHNAWYAGLDEGHSQKETPVSTKTFTDDEVYAALQGKDSLDALLVWRLAEAAHGIKEAQKGCNP